MKVRKLTRRARVEYVMDYTAAGKRIRRWFRSRAAAEADLGAVKDQIRNYGRSWMNIDATERTVLLMLHAEAKRDGLDLRAAYEAFKLSSAPTIGKTLGECITETMSVKRAENLRPRYVAGLGNYLKAFAAGREELPISRVTIADIEEWFAGRAEPPNSRRGNLGRLSTVFDQAWRRGYVPENVCLKVSRPRVEQRPPKIFTPSEAKRLLAACRQQTPALLPWLVLGLFAGIRPDELRRLTWADLDTEQGHALISAATSKVRRRRIVPLHPTALAWLRVCKRGKPTDPICLAWWPHRVEKTKLLRAASTTWDQDILRHSAASYLLALRGDAGKVAHLLGHSAAILESTYKAVVTPSDCQVFWKLTPSVCR